VWPLLGLLWLLLGLLLHLALLLLAGVPAGVHRGLGLEHRLLLLLLLVVQGHLVLHCGLGVLLLGRGLRLHLGWGGSEIRRKVFHFDADFGEQWMEWAADVYVIRRAGTA